MPPPVTPPAGPTAFTFRAGIVSAAGGPGTVSLDFLEPESGFEVAAFVSQSRGALFSSPPLIPGVGVTRISVNGLTDGADYFVGLGVREVGATDYSRAGPVMTVRPGIPVYVDVDSVAASPDGNSPATAFPDLLRGMLTAFAGGRPVWVRGGTYQAANLPLGTGVSVLGGFGPAFDLDTRDTEANATTCVVPSGQIGMQAQDPLSNGQVAVIDGLRFEGQALGSVAIDVLDCSIELRDVQVRQMRDRGIRARNSRGDQNFDLVMSHCESVANGADGLSGAGAFDYFLHDCFFASNVQEGIDLNGLEPETGGTATLELTASRMFGNGAEGLDATLTLPLSPSSGSYSVRIRGCAFERNQASGCLVDHDYELNANYSSQLTIEDSFSRANAGAGFHLDLDGPGPAHLSRVLAYGNGQQGLYVTSESHRALATVSTSAFLGNLGEGLRAEGPVGLVGNRTVAVTHSVFSGNMGGGMFSRDVVATATSTIAYLQPSPFTGVTQVGCVASDSPVDLGFLRAPEVYARVNANSAGTLALAAPATFTTAFELELANDTISRTADTIAGATVVLTEAPEDLGIPGVLAAFVPGIGGVQEDFRLLPGSVAIGAGMAPSGGPTVDAGPAASPIAGPPGFGTEGPTGLFYPTVTIPAPSAGIASVQDLLVRFSSDLDGASVNGSTVRALRGSTSIPVILANLGDTLTIVPLNDWGTGPFRIELDPAIRSIDGVPLSCPMALEISR